jgi:hypothetical protein
MHKFLQTFPDCVVQIIFQEMSYFVREGNFYKGPNFLYLVFVGLISCHLTNANNGS